MSLGLRRCGSLNYCVQHWAAITRAPERKQLPGLGLHSDEAGSCEAHLSEQTVETELFISKGKDHKFMLCDILGKL